MKDTIVIDPVSRWILHRHASKHSEQETTKLIETIENCVLRCYAFDEHGLDIATMTHGKDVYDIIATKSNAVAANAVMRQITINLSLSDSASTFSLSHDRFICRQIQSVILIQTRRQEQGRLRLGNLISGMSNRMPKISSIAFLDGGRASYGIERGADCSWTRARATARNIAKARTSP